MKNALRLTLPALILTVGLARTAPAASLILNGNFTGITNSIAGNSYTYGQFGNNDASLRQASGAVLTVDNWTTSGYNFVYTPNTVDQGTTAAGANAGIAKEAPGQAKVNGFGNEYMWGKNNGSTGDFNTTNYFSGNFVAADGAYEVGAISQAITGLRTGQAYNLTFYYAAAQQESYPQNPPQNGTTEQWQVTLGSKTFTTTQLSIPDKGFSGWKLASFTFDYTDTATMPLISFLAVGGPSGQPPFVLLANVGLTAVPEPSSVALFGLLGAGLAAAWFVRRRRRLAMVDAEV